MCSTKNFTRHFERSLSLSTDPNSFLNPVKHAKNNLGNDMDHFMGNADKRNQWKRNGTAVTGGVNSMSYTDQQGQRLTENYQYKNGKRKTRTVRWLRCVILWQQRW